jgi:Ankyrin repeats (many copies)
VPIAFKRAKKNILLDTVIITVVTLMAIGANLPARYSDFLSINKELLLMGLGLFIAFALVRYLKFALVLAVAILSLGANLPNEIALQLGIDPQIMLYALAAMVVTSLINFILKLPKGVKPIAQINSTHGARTLCHAALKGHASMVYSLISAGINPNYQDENGNLPLITAASQGHALVVKLLLDNGADVTLKDKAGNTALMASTKGGYTQTSMLLKNAELKVAVADAA